MTENATYRRRELGERLRQARIAAGMTQSRVAAALGVSQGKIHKIEQSLTLVKLAELANLIRLYEISPEHAEHLMNLAQLDSREAVERTAWSGYHNLIELEERAGNIFSWHSERIPNILQAEAYMLAQAQALGIGSANVGDLMQHRIKRQQLFARSDAPEYGAILSESSLRRMPRGQDAIALDQCFFLIGLMERFAHVTVQVLTFSADIPYVDSDFVLIYPRESGEGVAYIEYVGDSRIVKKRHDIEQMRDFWNSLREAALSREETIGYLREFMARLEEAR